MREIKFRGWIKKKKLMVYFGLFETDMTYLYYAKDKNGDFGLFIDEENDPIMQYTGLKDKKDKEIYEGDIVRWIIPEDISEFEREKRIIFWNKDSCGFFGKTLDSKYHCFINGELFEIIGNIYENPELLK